jgi:hypothetical protein
MKGASLPRITVIGGAGYAGSAIVEQATLAPRGALTSTFRDVNRTIAELADAAGAQLYVSV